MKKKVTDVLVIFLLPIVVGMLYWWVIKGFEGSTQALRGIAFLMGSGFTTISIGVVRSIRLLKK